MFCRFDGLIVGCGRLVFCFGNVSGSWFDGFVLLNSRLVIVWLFCVFGYYVFSMLCMFVSYGISIGLLFLSMMIMCLVFVVIVVISVFWLYCWLDGFVFVLGSDRFVRLSFFVCYCVVNMIVILVCVVVLVVVFVLVLLR